MKYLFDLYKGMGVTRIQRGFTEIVINNGEAVCSTPEQVELALSSGGVEMVSNKKTTKKLKAIKND